MSGRFLRSRTFTRVWIATVVLLVAGAGAWYATRRDESVTSSSAGKFAETSEQVSPPTLAGGRVGRERPSTATGDPTEEKRIHIHGVVLDSEGNPTLAALVGVLCGESPEQVDSALTDGAGHFDLRVDGTACEGSLEAKREVRVIAADERRALQSAPMFLDLRGDPTEPAPAGITLRLGAACRLRGRIVDRLGGAVAGGRCLVRWELPEGVTIWPAEAGWIMPIHHWIDADDHGLFATIVSKGLVRAWGQVGHGALGEPVAADIRDAPMVDLGDVVAGAEAARLRVRVLDERGKPIANPVATMPKKMVAHLILNDQGHVDDGMLHGGADGMLTLSTIDSSSGPMPMIVGASGYCGVGLIIDPREASSEKVVTLLEKSRLVVRAVSKSNPLPNTSVEMDIDLAAREVAKERTGAMVPEDLWTAYEERMPDIEALEKGGGLERDFRVGASGKYGIEVHAGALTFPAQEVVLSGRTGTTEVDLALPAGRWLRLSMPADAGPEQLPYSAQLTLTATGFFAVGDAPAARQDIRVVSLSMTRGASHWIWVPDGTERLRLLGSRVVDLPAEQIELAVPSVGNEEVRLPTDWGSFGTVLAETVGPEGDPVPGATIEVFANAGAEARRGGSRVAVSENNGIAKVAVPPGDYYVAAGSRYGAQKWDLIHVQAGAEVARRIRIPR